MKESKSSHFTRYFQRFFVPEFEHFISHSLHFLLIVAYDEI